jgi:excinuclease UvrABC helicase subunit UvrB
LKHYLKEGIGEYFIIKLWRTLKDLIGHRINAAKDLDFLQAAKYRDELAELRKLLKSKRD